MSQYTPKLFGLTLKKIYGQGTEHGLMRCYPVSDGRYQLVTNNNIQNKNVQSKKGTKEKLFSPEGTDTLFGVCSANK